MNLCLAMAIGSLILATIPAIMFAGNLRQFNRLPDDGPGVNKNLPPISVLIPARNEAGSIASAVVSVLANTGIVLELIVLDDHSTDGTAEIVNQIAAKDDRLRLFSAPALPDGWCGKQYACQVLSDHARYQSMLWMDADVRLENNALATMAVELARNPAALLSGFPFQGARSWLEILLIPLMHFILLGFLPIKKMRRHPSPSLGAGCGQLFLTRRRDYVEAGGHAAIRASLHDGITLPRAFRKRGKLTDIFDASSLAQCRMYDSAGAVWRGLLKNAGEGIATPAGIFPWTVLLLGGQVFPAGLTIYLLIKHPEKTLSLLISALAAAMGITIRLICARRYYSRNPSFSKYASALAHPIGVFIFLLIQWHSVIRRLTGRHSTWKGRSYSCERTDTIVKQC